MDDSQIARDDCRKNGAGASSLHTALHGGGANAVGGTRNRGGGLLHLRLGSKGPERPVLGSISCYEYVSFDSGDASNNRRHLLADYQPLHTQLNVAPTDNRTCRANRQPAFRCAAAPASVPPPMSASARAGV